MKEHSFHTHDSVASLGGIPIDTEKCSNCGVLKLFIGGYYYYGYGIQKDDNRVILGSLPGKYMECGEFKMRKALK
jgi:hypothetical protein